MPIGGIGAIGARSLVLGATHDVDIGTTITNGIVHGIIEDRHLPPPESSLHERVIAHLDPAHLLHLSQDADAVREAFAERGLRPEAIPFGVPATSIWSSFRMAFTRASCNNGFEDQPDPNLVRHFNTQWESNMGLKPITPHERQLGLLLRAFEQGGANRTQSAHVTYQRQAWSRNQWKENDYGAVRDFANAIRTYVIPGGRHLRTEYNHAAVRFPSIAVVDQFYEKEKRWPGMRGMSVSDEAESAGPKLPSKVYVTWLSEEGYGHELLPLNLVSTKALPNGSSISNYAIADSKGSVVHEMRIYRSSDGNILKISHNKPGGTENVLGTDNIWFGNKRDRGAVTSMFEQAYVWEDVKIAEVVQNPTTEYPTTL